MILMETEEDIRRSQLFTDSVNSIWHAELDGRRTPALLYYKTVEPGRFEYIHIGWSKETEKIERRALAKLEKLTADDGLRNGGSQSYGYWLGPAWGEMRQFHEDMSEAHSIHRKSLDKAVKILRDAIVRIETTIDPDFPPIGELYFDLARIYFEHSLFEEHDAAYEKGLSYKWNNLETRPEFFGHGVAEKLKTLAHIYLDRDQITPALGVYARLKQARSKVPAAVAEVMHEDWNKLAEFYERHGNIDEAIACYRSIGEQIDWNEGPEYEEWEPLRTAATALIRLDRPADAEHIYEQLLDWGLNIRKKIDVEKGWCSHTYPCGHWFEPYFQLLQDQNRLQHRSQVFERLGMNEAAYLPAPVEELYGYVDVDGQWNIPQRFEEANNFKDGKAAVVLTPEESKHGRGRLIDTSGNIVGYTEGPWSKFDLLTPDGYRQAGQMHDGLFPVAKIQEKKSKPYGGYGDTSRLGYADEHGNLVIEAKFTEAKPFHRGFAIVAVGGYIGSAGGCVISLQDGRYGLIDRTGKYIIEPIYTRLTYYNQEFDDGLLIYFDENGGGVITTTGEIRSVLPGCRDLFYVSNGMAEAQWGDDVALDDSFPEQKSGYLDADGRIVLEPQFDYARSFEGDRAAVRIDGKHGFINRKGELVLDAIYDTIYVWGYKHGIVPVEFNGKWGCIDEDGNFVVEPIYDKIDWTEDENGPGYFEPKVDYKDAVLLVTSNEKLGLVDRSGKVLCPPRFDSISKFADGIAFVTSQGFKALIDTYGVLQTELRFHDVKRFTQGLACVATMGDDGATLWGYIDRAGNFAIEPSFSQAEPFAEGLAAVRQSGSNLWGFITPDGEFAIEPKYESADSFNSGRARVGFGTTDDDKVFGIIDTHGNFVVQPEYAAIGHRYADGLCVVGKKRQRKGGGSTRLMKL